jgi:hypothetical protein
LSDDYDELLSLYEPSLEARGLEWLLTDPLGFGIQTATAVQRAACRIREGKPLSELREHPEVVASLGGREAIRMLPSERGMRPVEVYEVASPRTAKTIRACASALLATQTVDVSQLGPGEVPRVSIVSLKLDVAQVPFGILTKTVEASPLLRRLLVRPPTQNIAMFRHPSGREVEIACVAGAKAGAGLVARWSAGVIFDEAPRMQGQEDGIVNLDDARSAVVDRLLPGAQIQYPGSPWAPFGPVYETVQKHFGRPTEELVVMRTTGPAGNPFHWTPELCERLKRQDENAYRVGVLGEFVDAETAMFLAGELERCAVLDGDMPKNDLWSCVAVMDPATRGNAWTLVVLCLTPKGLAVMLARQWAGTTEKPLSPRDTLAAVRDAIAPYGLDTVHSDQWSADALIELGRAVGLTVLTHTVTGQSRVDGFESMAVHVRGGTLILPRSSDVLRDISAVRKRVTQTGVTIDLPKTADGRHADFAAAIALGVTLPIMDPKPEPQPEGTGDYAKRRKRELSTLIRKQQRGFIRVG